VILLDTQSQDPELVKARARIRLTLAPDGQSCPQLCVGKIHRRRSEALPGQPDRAFDLRFF
jgi:hypothetical protein